MPVNLSIKEVPDSTADRLCARAERNHRSLQGELMAIIERAVSEEADPPRELQHLTAAPRGSRSIEEIAARHRLKFPKPIATGPLAVDIIRADRDSR